MDLLMGIPREIRSDEWLINTPFALSQLRDGLHPVSSLLASGDTNVTPIYAHPCWSFSTLFRPFLWGHLFFDASAGLAFFWIARLVILFLVTIQFGLYLFSQRRGISFAFASMVTFSSTVQWWFAVNGIAELFIFGQGLVVALDCFLKSESLRSRFLISTMMSWAAAAYVLVIYPAWQVVLFWIFFILGILVLPCLFGLNRRKLRPEASCCLLYGAFSC